MIPYGHQAINKSDIAAVVKVLRSEWLTQGPVVEKFEQTLASYCGVKYAVAFSSGTAALHGAYAAAGLRNGDEFVTSPLTFVATVNAGLYLGAKPVFADIDERGNIDPNQIEKHLNKKTKLICPIDYGGHPAGLLAIRSLARAQHLLVVEDACHALGASLGARKIGSISDLTVFSFHPVKSITTGEGGVALTNRPDLYEYLKLFRTHGITKDPVRFQEASPGEWHQEMQLLGFNFRLTDIQAALGLSQLKRLDQFMRVRHRIAAFYTKAFQDVLDLIHLPEEERGASSSWHLYAIRLSKALVKRKKEIFQALRKAGIGVQVHYPLVYQHPYYQRLGYREGLCPKAEAFADAAISLPIFPSLAREDQQYVAKTVIRILQKFAL